MKKILSAIFFFCACHSFAQTPTWSDDVAVIVYNNCSKCHHEGAIGPFTLMSYQDAVDQSSEMEEHVAALHMPPWPADPDYRHFKDEACLSDDEINTILDWIAGGTPHGNILNEPTPPVFPPSGSQLEQIDFVVEIEPYTLQYNTDEYRWFVIETNFPNTVYLNAIEVIPGLPESVHHADISYDLTGNSLQNDLQDPLSGFNSSTGGPTYSHYINAWMAGADVMRYPTNWGVAVPPGADFVLEIHYGPDHQGETDTTKMNLKFTSDTDFRAISAGWLLNHDDIVDGPLAIPANTVRTFHHEWTTSNDLSLVSICPHMHRVGKSFKIWFENPAGDSIPLIDIPQWSFHWQLYYTFQMMQVIPAGSTIKSEGVYDNTVNNPDNPNSPPQNVYAGSTTESEMFMCFITYDYYEDGDEDIVLDSSILNTGFNNLQMDESSFEVYPNPINQFAVISWQLADEENAMIKIYNQIGQEIFLSRLQASNFELQTSNWSSGIYFVEISTPSYRSTKKIVKL